MLNFYILHIVVVVAGPAADGVAAGDTVVVIMREDTDVTSWWYRLMDGILSSDNTSLGPGQRPHVNWVAD